MVTLAPTPRDVMLEDGAAKLYRFRGTGTKKSSAAPLLLVPSLINRWYVVDLRPGYSLAASLVDRGFDVWCLDWGAPGSEDRYFTWDDVLTRLSRAARRVRKETGAGKTGILGYCIGGTLSGIHAALEPDTVAALVNLAGPFDFTEGGFLAHMTNPRWFDPSVIAAAGNITSQQMQSGFQMLRPTLAIAKWVGLMDRYTDRDFRTSFEALEEWANDNIDFPAAAYATYIRELYQENRLVRGEHHARGTRVDLKKITCPVLTVATSRDTICPPKAAEALNAHVGAKDKEVLVVPGGHVGAVVGSKAPQNLYPAIGKWLEERL
ncbi:MAG TPA: alpha/beta fold hydrolase [bacterium]|nr:alpha/beta fold hydrolase [bacterium]